jgi:NADH-quinone oxidoreductase subunit L
MLAPLVILAALSVVGGWIGIPEAMGGSNAFEHYLAPAIHLPAAQESVQLATEHAEHTTELLFAGISVSMAALGFFFAWLLYYKRPELPARITARMHGIYSMVLHRYYIDEGYDLLFVKPLMALSTIVLWKGVDQGVIDGTVNGAGELSKDIGGQLRKMQSGNIRSYAAWIAAGGAVVIAYMIWTVIQ